MAAFTGSTVPGFLTRSLDGALGRVHDRRLPGCHLLDDRALDRSDRETKDSESKLRAVLNAAADAIITIDTFGVIQEFNAAAQEIFCFKPEEIIGRNISRLMSVEESAKHDRYVAGYMSAENRDLAARTRESVGVRRDGRQFPMELSVSKVETASGLLFTEIVRDISARKIAEADLNAAKNAPKNRTSPRASSWLQ